VELCLEEEVCARHSPARGDGVHAQRVGVEPATGERPAALVGIGEHVVARPFRSLDGGCVGGESGLSDLVLGVAVRQPGGERKPPTRNEDAVRLGEGAHRLRDVQNPEVHRDRVERGVGERQPQRIAHHEREVGTAHASPFDHRGRDVHAHRMRSARRSRLGNEARSTRHIEKPPPRPHSRGVEERLDEQDRVGPVLLVARRRALPARALKLRKRITTHPPHCTAAHKLEMSRLPSLSSIGGPLVVEPSARAAAVTAVTGFQTRWSGPGSPAQRGAQSSGWHPARSGGEQNMRKVPTDGRRTIPLVAFSRNLRRGCGRLEG
jgi:hypothetical protein